MLSLKELLEQIAGRYIKGGKLRDKDATWRQKAVGIGYQQVCGFADVWGDGVVPEPSAHLPGLSFHCTDISLSI